MGGSESSASVHWTKYSVEADNEQTKNRQRDHARGEISADWVKRISQSTAK
jgi:hypothetical protein